jgi:hypothetical protein
MSFGKLFRRHLCAASDRGRRTDALCRAIGSTYFEILEVRRLMSTYHIPDSGSHTDHSVVYLTQNATAGYVDVRLDSLGNSPITTLTDTSDIISASTYSNFLFVDEIPAVDKPSGGISFTGGSGCTLKTVAGDADQLIELSSSTSAGGTITTTDASDTVTGADHYDSTVTHLIIRTNDVVATMLSEGTVVNVGTGFLTGLYSGTYLKIETGGLATYDTINLGGGDVPVTGAGTGGVLIQTGAGHDTVNLFNNEDDDIVTTVDFGAGNGTGDGLGLVNLLHIETFGTATLAQYPGSAGHTVVVDNVDVIGGTLNVGNQSTIGDLEVTSAGTAIIGADSTAIPVFGVDSSSTASIQAAATIGTFTENGIATFTGTSAGSTVDTLDLGGTVNVNYGADVTVDAFNVTSSGIVNVDESADLAITTATVSGTVTMNLTSDTNVTVDTFNASGTVNVNTGGLLTVGTFDASGTVNIDAALVSILTTSTIGTLNITSDGKATLAARVYSATTIAANVRYLYLDNLNLGSIGSESGTLDMNDNDLVVNNGDFSTIQNYMFDGYSTTVDSTKVGIISSTSQSLSGGTTLAAMFSNALGGVTDYPFGGGHTIGANAVVAKYTYFGDADWNGQVDSQDYTPVDANLGATGLDLGFSWFAGDMNFDGNVDVVDIGAVDAGLGLGVGNPL